ncbi:MAG: T9SS type A sorting domain-containing protein [Algoriphagus sp.]|nr:T9SS type A sorting domain-containing protein [Algoriphagus sp.]
MIAQEDSLIEVNQADEGFNLIANPTASVIDFHAATGWTKTNLDQSIYVWDPASSSFLTWNGTTGSLGSGRIAPFQGFWVKTNAASPLLRLDGNAPKLNLSTDFFGRKQAEPTSILELNVIGEGMSASSYLSFGEDGLLGADAKDAYQLESLAEDWLLLYSFGSLRTKSPLVINHQPSLTGEEDRVIPLHLAAARNGEPFKGAFLMDWKLPASWNADYSLVLMDHINQKAIDMKKESVYAFEFEAPKSASSFARKDIQSGLTPKAVVFQTPYSLDEEEIITNARTSTDSKSKRPFTLFVGRFPDGKVEYLPDFPKLFSPAPNPFVQQTKIRFFLPVAEQAEIKIFSLLGQEVGGFPTQEYGAGIHELDWIPQAISIPPGIYIIRLVTPTGQFTQKLIKN